MEILKTEKDYIKEAIIKARQFHFDGKTPSDVDVEKLGNELYDNLFGYRDSKKESPLDRPTAYHLIDVFKELKFGRTSEDQLYLQKCIEGLEVKSPVGALQNLVNEFRDYNYEWEKFMRKEAIRMPKSIDEFINEINKKYVVGYNSLG